MRIVNPGPDASVEKQVICPNCGTTIAYVPNDVKSRSGIDYGGGPDGSTWIVCPSCRKQIVLSSW
jgi:predicted RNA-binding Zn-ribbon protein involved in translation (DUF1610 family)